MKVDVPYGREWRTIDVEEENLIGVFKPADIEQPPLTREDIAFSIASPIGCEKLDRWVGPGKTVAIAVDDNTRITPVHDVLVVLQEKLTSLGVKKNDILVIVALGTHRKMTDEEMKKKFGSEILEEMQVISHEWDNPSELRRMGNLPNGVPILINKHFIDADIRIGIGNIVPHFTSGWSGGSKILLPGLAGAETVAGMHYYGAKTLPNAIGRADNVARELMDDFARKVGLHMIINTVLTRDGKIAGIYSGDPVKAHRKGIEHCKRIYGIPIPEAADITIVSSHPADIEFWQSMKGLYSADLCTKKNGGILLITPSPEGLSVVHKDWGDMLACSSKELEEQIERGEIEDVTAASIALCVIKTRETPYKIALYSEGISQEQAEQLHFEKVSNPQEGLEYLNRELGKDSKKLVLTHGGESLPILEG